MKSESNTGFPRFTRFAPIILLLLAGMIPMVALGAYRALLSTSNDPRQWLPRDFDETDKHAWFQQHFGSDEIAVVSWPGCALDDPRVEALAVALEQSAYFDRATTGPRVLKQLVESPLHLPLPDAIERLRGFLVGVDGQTTCVLLVTSALGRMDRLAAVGEIGRRAWAECELPTDELRLGGPTVDAAAIDVESRRLLFQLAGISAVVSFIVATLRLKSIRLAVMVLLGAVYSTCLTLAVLYASGGEMNLLMTMLPPLIYVLTISASVHLVNYYRDAADHVPLEDAPTAAIAQGWLPCVLAAFTTAIGLASLMLSKIDPIRLFGIYSAVGVLLSGALLFLYLPAALHVFPPVTEPRKRLASARRQKTYRLGDRVLLSIVRHHILVTAGCLTLMAFGGWGFSRVQSTIKLQDRFLPGSEVLEDYRWLEENLGPMVPLEVVIRFDRTGPLDFLQRVQLVADVQREIRSLPHAVTTMSAADLTPRIPVGGGVRQVVQRRLLNRRLTDKRQTFVAAHFLAENDREQLWRITVRADALGRLDYGSFADTLRRKIEPLLQGAEARATYTGVIPLIYKAQRQLLQDLVRSFCTAFAVIAVVLVIVLRSLPAAMLAMVPNLFPAVVVFGAMGWIELPVQIGSVMTASAALGIAVDDTVHFLTWFRRGFRDGWPRMIALRGSFQRCAGAMVGTTIICASGLLVFSASAFVPILHFAWLMVLLLLAALLGDLVLLPAILAGPLGRFFEERRAGKNRQQEVRPLVRSDAWSRGSGSRHP
jgi:predicted RND superfamily exporter protein